MGKSFARKALGSSVYLKSNTHLYDIVKIYIDTVLAIKTKQEIITI